jgi:hypothetical protein
MHPRDASSQYSAIAEPWNARTARSRYAVPYLQRAMPDVLLLDHVALVAARAGA